MIRNYTSGDFPTLIGLYDIKRSRFQIKHTVIIEVPHSVHNKTALFHVGNSYFQTTQPQKVTHDRSINIRSPNIVRVIKSGM
jgi:hypothetical protein